MIKTIKIDWQMFSVPHCITVSAFPLALIPTGSIVRNDPALSTRYEGPLGSKNEQGGQRYSTWQGMQNVKMKERADFVQSTVSLENIGSLD
jgi:hypothetical protein